MPSPYEYFYARLEMERSTDFLQSGAGFVAFLEDKFMICRPTGYQTIDADKTDAWFERNAGKLAEEFDWLFEEWKKDDSD